MIADKPWQLELRAHDTLPPLAWVARVSAGCVVVSVGQSVRQEGDAFFEGTWSGSHSLESLPEQSTLFGSGMTVTDSNLFVLTPSHQLEAVYYAKIEGEVVVSNSLVGVLAAAGLELDPVVDYPSIFGAGNDLWKLVDEEVAGIGARVVGGTFEIPTRTVPVTSQRFENLRIERDLSVAVSAKPRERPFASFDDFRTRLTEATASLIANASSHEPLVALSAGYDSTAVAAIAAQVGCREAVGFPTARPSRTDGTADDSGAAGAAVLGMDFELFDRLAYRRSNAKPEADFLATGHPGEEIIFSGMANRLRRRTLLNGYWAGRQWAMSHRDDWRHIAPSTSAGASITEFRLRNDFYFVPLACFAAAGKESDPSLLDMPDMDDYRIGGRYDRPIPRRLAEEAGIPRGTFGVTKRAANVVLPVEGVTGFTAETRASIAAFAAAEGSSAMPRARRPFGRIDRAALRVAERLGTAGAAARLRRRQKSLLHFDPQFGNLAFRWAVSEVAPRYAAVAARRNQQT